jgi:hypothetical protein
MEASIMRVLAGITLIVAAAASTVWRVTWLAEERSKVWDPSYTKTWISGERWFWAIGVFFVVYGETLYWFNVWKYSKNRKYNV